MCICTNKYERYYWTQKVPACLLTLLCYYGKPRLCINIHHYAPPIGCSITHWVATSLAAAGCCDVSEGSMSSLKSTTWKELWELLTNYKFKSLRRQICRECQHECVCKVLLRSTAYKESLRIYRELITTTRTTTVAFWDPPSRSINHKSNILCLTLACPTPCLWCNFAFCALKYSLNGACSEGPKCGIRLQQNTQYT